MRKSQFMTAVFLAAALMPASFSATAQTSVAKEITWFRAAQAALSPSAAKCNLTDPSLFAGHLSEQLQGIGISRNQNSRLVATLSIAAVQFGLLGSQCAYNVTFQFQTYLTAQEVNTKDPRVRASLARLGNLPLSIYQDGVFGVTVLSASQGAPDTAQKKVKEAISVLVGRLKAARSR